jgi:hypothetical protein
MKLMHTEHLINMGNFSQSAEFIKIHQDLIDAIAKVTWPPNADTYTINPTKHGNGVTPIKGAFIQHLFENGWYPEYALDLDMDKKPGRLDAVYRVGTKYYAVEWETGNISSSHRALNKLALGLMRKVLIGGTLVLPTRKMYQYLTDRVGNYTELEPYFDIWRSIKCETGVLTVLAIEHDATNNDIPLIPKGTDGRARG